MWKSATGQAIQASASESSFIPLLTWNSRTTPHPLRRLLSSLWFPEIRMLLGLQHSAVAARCFPRERRARKLQNRDLRVRQHLAAVLQMSAEGSSRFAREHDVQVRLAVGDEASEARKLHRIGDRAHGRIHTVKGTPAQRSRRRKDRPVLNSLALCFVH